MSRVASATSGACHPVSVYVASACASSAPAMPPIFSRAARGIILRDVSRCSQRRVSANSRVEACAHGQLEPGSRRRIAERIYFFFSGHGAPATDQSTYLFPYDGDARDIPGTAVAMSDVMASLGATSAHDVLAVIDSCFSGAGGRSVLPPGARALVRVQVAPPAAQLALFTASKGDEISGPAPGENQGAFTKFVVQGLGTGAADINGDGQISLQELSTWVSSRVALASKQDNREQHPTVVLGNGLGGVDSFIVDWGVTTR